MCDGIEKLPVVQNISARLFVRVAALELMLIRALCTRGAAAAQAARFKSRAKTLLVSLHVYKPKLLWRVLYKQKIGRAQVDNKEALVVRLIKLYLQDRVNRERMM